MKFYPELVLAVMRSNKPTGGVRLFCVAKHYDNGNGNIPVDEFKAYAKRYLGIGKSRFNRWMREALRLGIVKRYGNVLTIISWGRAAVAVGITSPLRNPVEIGITKIVNDGWAAWVWAAYLKRHEGKPIARATLERLTGVPERTQRAYEIEAGVERQANYATEKEPIAEERDGYFWYYGQPKKRLGNTYLTSGVEECKRGRTKEHNRIIWAASSLWDGSTQKQRLYFRLPKKAQALAMQAKANKAKQAQAFAMLKSNDAKQKAEALAILRNMEKPENIIAGKQAKTYSNTLHKMRKSNQPHNPYNPRPNTLYLHVCDALGVGLWEALPCN